MQAQRSIVIADDHSLVRIGIRSLLERDAQFSIVGEATDGEQALDMILACNPDLVLMDIDMPRLSGIDVATRLRAADFAGRIIILSASEAREAVIASLRAGSSGYLVKDLLLGELEMALRAVLDGKQYLSPRVAHHLIAFVASGDGHDGKARSLPDSPLDALTDRQRDVLKGIARGLSTKEIARELIISPKTVEFHRAQISERLDTHDIASLVRLAVRHGLVKDN